MFVILFELHKLRVAEYVTADETAWKASVTEKFTLKALQNIPHSAS
jgi:hypothetical protein